MRRPTWKVKNGEEPNPKGNKFSRKLLICLYNHLIRASVGSEFATGKMDPPPVGTSREQTVVAAPDHLNSPDPSEPDESQHLPIYDNATGSMFSGPVAVGTPRRVSNVPVDSRFDSRSSRSTASVGSGREVKNGRLAFHCFEDVNVLTFLVAINQCHDEFVVSQPRCPLPLPLGIDLRIETLNWVAEAATLFDSFCHPWWFRQTQMILC
ncbi:hypothetical protein MJO29_007386 [Puccinia striiformis f. sp. tritici]|nr:hypothetical protein MJO29_007386 [Puccinia striiformis f. sp. tritici]